MAKIAVAMSGGVDSSTAAFILKKLGHDVIGVTMKLWNEESDSSGIKRCCSLDDINDARRVCHHLGIKHYVFNLESEFKKVVVDDFVKQYLSGRTPNPCIICNEKIKFGILLKKAAALGFDQLATGHYAAVKQRKVKGKKRYFLKVSKDDVKEQTYFLCRLGQKELSKIVFPLSEHTKKEVRKIAEENGIPVATKAESQEICFIKKSYPEFIFSYLSDAPRRVKPGPICDKNGKVLGTHKGIICYTIGQRSGLGISAKAPLYVIGTDAKRNIISVGGKDDVLSKKMSVKDVIWSSGDKPKLPFKCKVKIRRQHKPEPAVVYSAKEGVTVQFLKPQHAITPGQSAVFYKNGFVLGSGFIEKKLV